MNIHRRPDLPRLADPRQGDLTNGSCALRGRREGSRGPSPRVDEAVISRLDPPNVQEVHSDNAAHAQLVLWMHRDRLGELRIGGQRAIERLYESANQFDISHGASGDFSIPVTIEPVSSLKKLTTKALIDSGCTGSAINQAYIIEHGLDTRKALIPIPVYNTDGTRNQGGDITEFVELR